MLKNKNLVIDGNGIFMRYFFALDEYFNQDGIPVHGLIGFLRCIFNLLKKYKPYSLLITFDKCYDNFRKEIDASYKSNRKKLDSSAIDQLNLAIEFCKVSGIPTEFHSRFESDDLIASYTVQNPDKEFIICSVDKDLCQLVEKNVVILDPFKNIVMKTEDVVKKYEVTPQDFYLFLALQGDSSDSVKGIRGIGPKTAAKILKSTKNIHEIPMLFPKFDFTQLQQQIELVKLVTNIELKNHTPAQLIFNTQTAIDFLNNLGIYELSYILNQI